MKMLESDTCELVNIDYTWLALTSPLPSIDEAPSLPPPSVSKIECYWQGNAH